MAKNQNMVQSKHEKIFMLVKQSKKVIVTVGEYKVVNREFDTFEQAEQYIASKPYKLIFNTFQILMNYAEKNKKTADEIAADTKNN